MSTSTYAHVGGGGGVGAAAESVWPQSAVAGLSAQESILNEPDAEMGLGASSSDPLAAPAGGTPPSKHKLATMFHLLFKIAALAMYLFCSLFFDNFILVFVVCVLLLAFDFWTVKNVTGRLLVGLRWWNEVREDGSNVWIFESKPDNREVHPTDSFIFWSSLYAMPIIWLVLGLSVLLRPQWLLIVAVAITFSGANVVGYWKCQRDAGRRVQSFITQQVLAHAVPQSRAV